MLLSLGCDNEKFVSLLERYAALPLRGPLDAALKEVT